MAEGFAEWANGGKVRRTRIPPWPMIWVDSTDADRRLDQGGDPRGMLREMAQIR